MSEYVEQKSLLLEVDFRERGVVLLDSRSIVDEVRDLDSLSICEDLRQTNPLHLLSLSAVEVHPVLLRKYVGQSEHQDSHIISELSYHVRYRRVRILEDVVEEGSHYHILLRRDSGYDPRDVDEVGEVGFGGVLSLLASVSLGREDQSLLYQLHLPSPLHEFRRLLPRIIQVSLHALSRLVENDLLLIGELVPPITESATVEVVRGLGPCFLLVARNDLRPDLRIDLGVTDPGETFGYLVG